MKKPVIALTIGKSHYPRMMSDKAWNALESFAEIIEHPGDEPAEKDELITLLSKADGCITSWGVAPLEKEILDSAPGLKAMAHMGSSVKRFVSPEVWARNLHVTTTAPALAIDVAETTLGLMIVGAKKIWQFGNHVREGGWRETDAWPAGELFARKIGIIGASHVGRHVIKLLQNFAVSVYLYDPFISKERAYELGAVKSELDTLVEKCDIVSLHAPAKEETHHIINKNRLKKMKDHTLLINTARGSLIDEEALIGELKKDRLFAFLDVTDPEPPSQDSPLRTLPNVVVLPHIAGCIENCGRMSEMAVEELRRFFHHEPALYKVTKDMLDRIA